MSMTFGEAILTIVAMALGTMATRFLPFLLFPDKRHTPSYVKYLGAALPAAAIAMLLVYCLKDVSLLAPPHGLPEALGVVFVALLHLWRKSVLLSIGLGTLFYMGLVQWVF